MRSNADLFADRGDAWATPNYQHAYVMPRSGRVVEGYGRDGIPKLAKPKVEPGPEPRRELNADLRRACNRALRIKARTKAIMRSKGFV